MLCDNCHEEVRPVVAIDVDGTMGDYHGHFLRFATNYLFDENAAYRYQLAMSAVTYDGAWAFGEYVCESLKIDKTKYREIKLAYRQGGMKRTMPIFQAAQPLCLSVKGLGADLWITTTRPYLSLDNIVPDTVEWCRRNYIAYDGMLFDKDKYTTLADRVDPRRIVAVLDDLPSMYDSAYEIFSSHPYSYHVPILIKGKYNKAVERPSMATLEEAHEIVIGRINWWREQYGS